ncbi:hypothetical protein [Streptomyces lydicus]|uniref:hypothetical protein n=1 Tax=Streptomyces lydicus TaxID=47763 RepID=UPI0037B34506
MNTSLNASDAPRAAASATPDGWKVLHDGGPGELVLAVDYASTGRRESSFFDIVPNLPADRTVWETTQPPLGQETEMGGAAYVARWMRAVTESGRHVRAVMGYCVGSVFAAALAEEIGRIQAEPPVVLMFDPSVPVSVNLRHDFCNVIDHYATILTEDEVRHCKAEAHRLFAEDDDFDRLGARYSRMFEEVVETAFIRSELDVELGRELSDTFVSFVRYLVAARQVDPSRVWARGTAVSSRDSTPAADLAGHEIQFHIDHLDILRDPGVGRAVTELLTAPR